MKRVAETLEVSRSQLSERLRRPGKLRSTYSKVGDVDLLAALRSLVDERPTYGYRRMTALMNRERLKTGLPRLNHKRIYRLMSQNSMLLQRYTGKPPGRAHDGKIITIRPNLRWTSDGFEIACWNSQVVRVAFSLDTCDREVMAEVRCIFDEIQDLVEAMRPARPNDQPWRAGLELISHGRRDVMFARTARPDEGDYIDRRSMTGCRRRRRSAWSECGSEIRVEH